MFVESHLGHFKAVSGIVILAIRARSAIEPGLIEPAPPPPWGCSGATTGGPGGSTGGGGADVSCCCWWWWWFWIVLPLCWKQKKKYNYISKYMQRNLKMSKKKGRIFKNN